MARAEARLEALIGRMLSPLERILVELAFALAERAIAVSTDLGTSPDEVLASVVRRELMGLATTEAHPRVLEYMGEVLPPMKRAIREVYPALSAKARLVEGRASPLVGVDVRAYATATADAVAHQLREDAAPSLAKAIRQRLTVGAETRAVRLEVSRQAEISLGRTGTLIERAVRSYREHEITAVGGVGTGDPLVFLYVGPPQSSPNIRDYCAARVGKLIHGGARGLVDRHRFNCRHSLAPILLSRAMARGLQFYEGGPNDDV